LHQLLRPALGQLDALPAPQGNALRSALGLADGPDRERFLVFAACLTLLSELAERRPVLCLVDDAHWLDAASADAVRFVARRLDAEGIVMLFGVREGHESSFEAPDLQWLRLSGLDPAAAAALLSHTGFDASDDVLRQLFAETRGNALALLEVPAALSHAQLAGSEPLPETLPLTERVERLFLARVRELPPDVQRLLLIAAADDTERVSVVRRAAGGEIAGGAALDAAESAGLLSVRGSHLEFRHPLVRSAVYGAATSRDRQAAHRAIAEALADDTEHVDRRAWHLAAAAVDPDDDVVNALDEAALRAEQRAAYGVAARAHERAADLSRDDDARARRLAAAAQAATAAGADDQAVSLAERALAHTADVVARADMHHVLALEIARRGRPASASALLVEAAKEVAEQQPAKALLLLLDGAWAASEGADRVSQLEIGRLARELAPRVDDAASRLSADLLAGLDATLAGDSAEAVPLLRRAIEAAEGSNEPRHVVWGGVASLWLGDDAAAERLLERSAALCRARGTFGILASVLGALSLQHLLAQQYDQAAIASRDALAFVRDVGAENLAALPLAVQACIAAIHGDDDVATQTSNQVLDYAAAHGMPLAASRPVWALALVDLGRGRWSEAASRLESLDPRRLAAVIGYVMQTFPDRIEAHVRAGDLDAAATALAALEAWAETRPSARWLERRVTSCRALLTSGDEASALYEAALAVDASGRPFDVARIHLLYGEHLRRERRRSDSRVQLRVALESFERLRAEPWSERARVELRASGETARKRDPSTTAHLTPQEVQIARLVSEGLSNKEVAAQLFLSPRTIDSHLRNIFGKLAITSRTQLARLSFAEGAAPA
jgi:DNA-binding CsgD family transcriptional regulator